MTKTSQKLENFLLSRLSYFLVALVVGGILSLILVISMQLSQSKQLITDRVRDIVALKQNEGLNSIALEDWLSLEEFLERMRADLNVEQVDVSTNGKTIIAKSNLMNPQGVWYSVLSLFIDASPLQFNLANDFGNFQAALTVHYQHQLFNVSIKPIIYYSMVFLAITLILVGILFFGILRVMNRNIIYPVRELAEAFERGDHSIEYFKNSKAETSILEIQNLFRSLSEFERLRMFRVENEKTKALNKLAAQVAHDIRSPLAALDTLVSHVSEFPEDVRLITRQAIGRIKDIANDLVQRFKAFEADIDREIVFLIPLIEAICSEKRMQFRKQSNLHIHLEDQSPEIPKFIEIEPVNFKRLISNLVNNSVEAMNEFGTITITVDDAGPDWVIKIEDTGSGFKDRSFLNEKSGEIIPETIRAGMGLKHACESMSRWGGKIRVQTSERGTTFNLLLKKRPAPSWSLDRLNIQTPGKIIIIDDDMSIHNVMEKRFEGFKAAGLEIEHHYRPEEIQPDNNCIYLVDYEFRNSDESGFDLIKRTGIAAKAVLVTSHFEDRELIAKALAIGLKILPKSLAVTFPIAVTVE